VVLNGDLPLRFGKLDLEALAQVPVLAPAYAAAAAYQRRSDLAQGYVEKLRANVKHPLARVEYRFAERFDRSCVEGISYDLAVLS
jgi:hypothetical protein